MICEASGGYERAVIQALQRRGIDVSLAPANRVRQFARSAGILAKTDRIDAAVLASFGTALRPAPAQAQPLPIAHLRELDVQRRHQRRFNRTGSNPLRQSQKAHFHYMNR